MSVIVQLSDTHITAPGRLAYGRVDTHAALARAVAHINALPARVGPIDAVVVSGDLTDLGTAEEYAAFRALTAPLAVPLHVLPGNHDTREGMRAAFAGGGLPGGEGPLDHAATAGALRLVALDSTVPGASHGWIEPGRLDRIDALLAEAPGAPTLVFCHHPPFDTGIGHMDRQRLLNGEALLARLARHPQVRLLGCGHVHRAITAVAGGVPCMIAPAPAHAVRLDTAADAAPAFDLEPGAVAIHAWRGGQLTSHVSYIDRYDGPYPFFGADGRLLG